jgi:hypothetical protein
MEQKDFILREIEKIGQILIALRQMLFGGKDNPVINIEKQVDDAKGKLLKELNFDLNKFLHLDNEETNSYLNSIEGFNNENIEQLADYISQIGFSKQFDESIIYLKKALQLFELINLKSKTYSIERESKIITIKNAL